jgi:hypothetical protein
MIYSDRPRKYSKRGKKWAHVCSPNLHELLAYAKRHGLRRKDRRPWIHFDVTEEELNELPNIEIVSRYELSKLMSRYRQPKTEKAPK